ncbi:MAG TPA: NADH-quinone oxidoreductase subunit A [Candidatus Kapabacteria bacterium]|jgi:NADH-quinone oxidoreductase subunit A|nr:NADH-quinone oxidoreductase subunit A [Candidatus Kapabacteria bacterium]
MLTEFSHVFAFLILAAIFVAGGLVTSKLVRPKNGNKYKLASYECGEDAIGGSWIKFNIRYYVVALIFILFDVEILFLFPWALVLKQMRWLALAEMFTFMAILLVGYIYVWASGDLEWTRPKPFIARMRHVVDINNYELPSTSERLGPSLSSHS